MHALGPPVVAQFERPQREWRYSGSWARQTSTSCARSAQPGSGATLTIDLPVLLGHGPMGIPGTQEIGRMSKHNVELTRRVVDANNARDLDAVIAYFDPNVEFHSVFAAVGDEVYHGHDGVRRYARDRANPLREIRLEPEAYYDLGEQTLIFYIGRGRGRQSGAEVAFPGATVLRWREDLIVYAKGYVHREDALRDLGITEDELEPIDP
jgi:ketosteroid isomerase-like protein